MWALLGFESATVPADKVRDPARTIPRATLVGTAVAAIVCAVACTVVVFLVPAEQLAASTAPFADAARPFWGERAAVFVGLAAAVSTFGCLNGWILLQGELPRVLARAGAFPRVFARESARATPVVALAFTSLLVTLLILANARRGLVGVFTFMILLSTCANLVAYLACGLAVLALLRQGRMGPARRGAPWLALAGVLGSAYCLWAMAGAGREALQWGAVLLAAGLPVYLARQRKPKTES
jgi:APA family basic amino acid/polyamine antiporter